MQLPNLLAEYGILWDFSKYYGIKGKYFARVFFTLFST